jgi:large subunit ribosomal protein L21
MSKFAVIQTGGKQYLVQSGDEIVVDRLREEENKDVELTVLSIFDGDKAEEKVSFDQNKKVEAKVIAHMKGDKLRVSRFKSKVRYRKVTGFRPYLTRLKIGEI